MIGNIGDFGGLYPMGPYSAAGGTFNPTDWTPPWATLKGEGAIIRGPAAKKIIDGFDQTVSPYGAAMFGPQLLKSFWVLALLAGAIVFLPGLMKKLKKLKKRKSRRRRR